jgi:hypothetical protein
MLKGLDQPCIIRTKVRAQIRVTVLFLNRRRSTVTQLNFLYIKAEKLNSINLNFSIETHIIFQLNSQKTTTMHFTATLAFSIVLAFSLATVTDAAPLTLVVDCVMGFEPLLGSNNEETTVCAPICKEVDEVIFKHALNTAGAQEKKCIPVCPAGEEHPFSADGVQQETCIPVCPDGKERALNTDGVPQENCIPKCIEGYEHLFNKKKVEGHKCLPVCNEGEVRALRDNGSQKSKCVSERVPSIGQGDAPSFDPCAHAFDTDACVAEVNGNGNSNR